MMEALPCVVPGTRAIATAGYRSAQVVGPRKCDRNVPYLHVEGADDPQLPAAGGTSCANELLKSSQTPPQSRAFHVDLWKTHHDCDGDGTRAAGTDEEPCTAWTCETPFMSCILTGGRPWVRQAGANEAHQVYGTTVGF